MTRPDGADAFASDHPNNREKWHGTPGGYNNHKCRCSLCKQAWAARQKSYRIKNKQAYLTESSVLLKGLTASNNFDYLY